MYLLLWDWTLGSPHNVFLFMIRTDDVPLADFPSYLLANNGPPGIALTQPGSGRAGVMHYHNMGDAVEPRKSARLRRGCVGRAGSAAAGHVTPEVFLQGVSIGWAHLQPEERKVVRAASRSGRHIHDRLTVEPRIMLGRDLAKGSSTSSSSLQPQSCARR